MNEETSWPPFAVSNSRERVTELKNAVEALSNERSDADQFVLSELSRLLVVRCSGHLEVTLSQCFLAFVARHSKSTIANYVTKTHKAWQSPKPDNLKKVFEQIDPKIKESFSAFVGSNGGALSFEVKAMVNQRGKVSHGDNDSITPRTALRYYEVALEVSDWVIDCFKPGGQADAISQ